MFYESKGVGSFADAQRTGCRESGGLNFSFDIILDSLPLLARAAVGTVIFASAAFAIGLPLGLLVCTGSLSSSRLPRFLSRMFVSFFRSVPLLVLLLIAYYGLPAMGLNTTATQAAVMALSVCEAAYLSECFRGGFLAVPKGQVEAARMFGYSRWQTLLRIKLPTVIRLSLPAVVNEATLAVKASSLISVVGILELARMSQNIAASTFRPLEIYLAAGAFYLVINIVVIRVGRFAERRFAIEGW